MNLHDMLTANVPPELLDALAGIAGNKGITGNKGIAGCCEPKAGTHIELWGRNTVTVLHRET